MSTELLARADRLRVQRTPFVLATVVRAERPTSAKAGDRAIVMSDGTIEGFVGGACAESTVRVQGLRLLDGPRVGGESTLLRITPDAATAQPATEGMVVVGNPCLSGGTLDIFLEAVLPTALVHVFGDSPIARALSTVASASGYAVTATDDPELAIEPDTAAVVVASHGRHEETLLAAALRAGVPYVGLVASPRRGAAVLASLSSLDLGEDSRARVRTPAGLNIGARTPLEVAVSVVAELVCLGVSAAAVSPPSPQAVPFLQTVPSLQIVPSSPTVPSLPIVSTPPEARVERGGPSVPLVEPAGVAVDPVCGMTVATVPASLRLDHAGRTWYFCGAGCQQAFAADPAGYGA